MIISASDGPCENQIKLPCEIPSTQILKDFGFLPLCVKSPGLRKRRWEGTDDRH